MSGIVGPDSIIQNLSLYLDAANYRSALIKKQSSNILVDPNTWSTGDGGTTGYIPNGPDSEQNRTYVNDDPWGGTSIIWRTLPDSISNADGGWNTTYHSIDIKYTYRWSVWVRRHTSGVGGNFYMGLNPDIIRNDNDTVQTNPYFATPLISALTQNQWYLVVGHCFYAGYAGGRHPDSGWYANGVKITDISYGNVGNEDVRWQSSTTSTQHRTYHYYSTNIDSGLEFAFPRIDKCDGSEPSIKDLLTIGESKWRDLTLNSNDGLFLNNRIYNSENGGTLVFDGIDDCVDLGNIFNNIFAGADKKFTISSWVNYNTLDLNGNVILSKLGDTSFSEDERQISFLVRNYNNLYGSFELEFFTYFNLNGSPYRGYRTVGANIQTNQWYNFVISYDGSIDGSDRYSLFVNGIKYTTEVTFTQGDWGDIIPGDARLAIGAIIGEKTTNTPSNLLDGKIANLLIYDRTLSETEVYQNFNAMRSRFGI